MGVVRGYNGMMVTMKESIAKRECEDENRLLVHAGSRDGE